MSSSEKVTPNESFSEPFPEISGLYFHDLEAPAKWGVVVDHLISKEKERCEIWKDEVTNILIFAGLFSGVVTAFIIESYQSLQTDPSELLLSRIAANMEFIANKTANAPAVLPAFVATPAGPGSPSKLVNALWFMSLILSLASALIGLVALQWLREHLRPSTRNVPLRTLPALIQMQAESLDAYYVPQTFTALPVLLILAIVLFFIGMVEFLWNINHTVAYPTMITISLILAFILYTTLRPGLQRLPPIGNSPVYQSKRVSSLSIPCPYRSPQSWAFLQATILISNTYSSISRHLHLPRRISGVQNASTLMKDWIDWAVSWPRQRDIDYVHSSGDPHALLHPFCDGKSVLPPVYDTIRALTQTNKDFSQMGNSNWDASMVNVDFAFDDFLDFDHGAAAYCDQLVDYVHSILDEPRLPLALPRDRLSQATREIKRTHANLLFTLSGVANLNELAGAVSSQLVDSALDLIEFNCGHLEQEIGVSETWFGPVALVWHYTTLYEFGTVGDEHEKEGVEKVIGIVTQIFQYAREHEVSTRLDTLGTSPYVRMVLHAAANILVHRSGSDSDIPRFTKSRHRRCLTALNDYLQLETSPSPYFFLLVSIYAHFLLVPISPRFWGDAVYVQSKAFKNLITTLKQLYGRFSDNSYLLELQRKIFPGSLEAHFVWAYLNPQYDQDEDNDDDSSSSDDDDDEDGDEDGDEDEDEDEWEDEDEDDKDGTTDEDDDQEKDEDIQIDTEGEGEQEKKGGRQTIVPERPRRGDRASRRRHDSRKGRKRTRNGVIPSNSLGNNPTLRDRAVIALAETLFRSNLPASKPCLQQPVLSAAQIKSEPLSLDTSRNQGPQQLLSFGPLHAYKVGPDHKMRKLSLVVDSTDASRCNGDAIVDIDIAKGHIDALVRGPHPIH